MRQDMPQEERPEAPAAGARGRAVRHDRCAGVLHDPAVGHGGGAGGLAGAALEAEVEVLDSPGRRLDPPLADPVDQVQSPPRRLKLLPGGDVGGARREAEAAVNAVREVFGARDIRPDEAQRAHSPSPQRPRLIVRPGSNRSRSARMSGPSPAGGAVACRSSVGAASTWRNPSWCSATRRSRPTASASIAVNRPITAPAAR